VTRACARQAGGGAGGRARQLPAQLRAVPGAPAARALCGPPVRPRAGGPTGSLGAQAEREAGLRRVAERQALVREVLEAAAVPGAEAPSRCAHGCPSVTKR
jgi:hypothetical protein